MIHMTGNLFDTTAPAIGHGINVMGRMGAGIAVQFRERYPEMHRVYVELCENYAIHPGDVMLWKADDFTVYNIASQDMPGPHASLEWLCAGVSSALNHASSENFDRLALPQIGCGIGGLKVDDVVRELTHVESNYSTEIEWWTYA